MAPTSDETRRRVRAALALGGYASVEALADALAARDAGIGIKRLRAIWQKGISNAGERREIADACGVPYWFMETGFRGADETADLEDRLENLEGAQRATNRRLQQVLDRLEQLAPADPDAP